MKTNFRKRSGALNLGAIIVSEAILYILGEMKTNPLSKYFDNVKTECEKIKLDYSKIKLPNIVTLNGLSWSDVMGRDIQKPTGYSDVTAVSDRWDFSIKLSEFNFTSMHI